MSLLFAVKVFGDLCLYFAAAGAVSGVCGQAMNGLWPMLVCAACAGLCCFAKSKPWRLLPLLLLGLCCLFPQNRTDWLLMPRFWLHGAGSSWTTAIIRNFSPEDWPPQAWPCW